ncbi:MAG TPA: Trm112 family protein [Thermodesulfovibrionia bacterium]|nr:Trm112 family protein [Thermodesulfovibrionia bacterium]
MPIKQELLSILCCPATKVPVEMLPEEKLQKINALILQKKVRYQDKSLVDARLSEGLITKDGKTIYRIDESIPIMLIDKGIAADCL